MPEAGSRKGDEESLSWGSWSGLREMRLREGLGGGEVWMYS